VARERIERRGRKRKKLKWSKRENKLGKQGRGEDLKI